MFVFKILLLVLLSSTRTVIGESNLRGIKSTSNQSVVTSTTKSMTVAQESPSVFRKEESLEPKSKISADEISKSNDAETQKDDSEEVTRLFDFLNGIRPLDRYTCPDGSTCKGCSYCNDGSLCADCTTAETSVSRVIPDLVPDAHDLANKKMANKNMHENIHRIRQLQNIERGLLVPGLCKDGITKCNGCAFCPDGNLCNMCQASSPMIRVLPEESHDLDREIHIEQEKKFTEVDLNNCSCAEGQDAPRNQQKSQLELNEIKKYLSLLYKPYFDETVIQNFINNKL